MRMHDILDFLNYGILETFKYRKRSDFDAEPAVNIILKDTDRGGTIDYTLHVNGFARKGKTEGLEDITVRFNSDEIGNMFAAGGLEPFHGHAVLTPINSYIIEFMPVPDNHNLYNDLRVLKVADLIEAINLSKVPEKALTSSSNQ